MHACMHERERTCRIKVHVYACTYVSIQQSHVHGVNTNPSHHGEGDGLLRRKNGGLELDFFRHDGVNMIAE